MGPRRMDGFARPAAAPSRPQPMAGAQQRPVAQRPAPQPAPMRQAPQAQPQDAVRSSKRRGGGAWRVVLQFVIGLLVIAGVAAAIVALYIRYYQ
jgi:hypothetical protein